MAGKKPKIEPGSFDDLESLARLPEESISPVFRLTPRGKTLYANKFTRHTPEIYDHESGKVKPDIVAKTKDCYKAGERGLMDVIIGDRVFELVIIPIDAHKYINVYGRDVTELRETMKRAESLAKFPNENPNPVMRAKGDGVLLFCNDAAEAIPGLVDTTPPLSVTTDLMHVLRSSLRNGAVETTHLASGDTTYLYTVSPVEGEQYANIYGRDVTKEIEAQEAMVATNQLLEQRIAERTASVRLLQNIVLAANSAESFEAALQTALHEICLYTHWPVGHAYVVEQIDGQNELKPSGIWHIETSSEYSNLREATEQMRFGQFDDLPGMVLANGREVWIENLSGHRSFRRQEFIENAGLKSAMAFPVTIHSQVIGVLEFFAQENVPANVEIIKTLEHVGAQLGSVAERKNAEAEVKKSREAAEVAHERLTDALEVMGQGFVLFDKDDNIALFNSKYAERVQKILGREPVVGDSFEQIMRASADVNYIPGSMEDKEQWLQRILKERKETKTRDSISKQNDGTWFRAEGYETRDGGTVSIFTDVTELKEKEEELAEMARQSELAHNRLRDAVEAIGQGFVLFDSDDRFVLYNQRYLEMMNTLEHDPEIGMTFEAVLRNTRKSDFGDMSRDDWIDLMLKERRDNPVRNTETHLGDKWFKTEGSLTAEGGIVSTFTDITELKEKEEALEQMAQESELRRTRLLDGIEALDQGFALFDEEDRYVMFNSQYSKMIEKLCRVPQVGETFADVLNDTKRTDFLGMTKEKWMEGVLAARQRDEARYDTNRLPDGTWYKAEGFRTSDGGNVSVFTDITDLKDHEAELDELVKELGVARDVAVEANSAKSQFLANMSHELRTPLNAIIGYSELLIDDVEDDENDAYIPDLEKIQKAGKHLLGLINDILDLSKIEVGKIEIFVEEFGVRDILDDVKNTIIPLMTKNNNELALEVSDDLNKVKSDLTKVRQNLFNLLSNASKFSKDSTVTLKAYPETDEAGHELAVFEVIDQGIGMTPEQLEKVFEPFTQADASTSKNFGGTGLGLTITREFCRMLGGDITASSVEGEGTTFVMKILVDGSNLQHDEDDHEIEVGADGNAPLILVIDDDPVVRDLLTRNLETAGYRVGTAKDGKTGLKKAKELKPDAITLDVVMPHTDGWTVLSELKADPDTADVPVVMVTISEDKTLGFSLGASEFMTKPVDRKKLVAVLSRFMRGDKSKPVLLIEDDPSTRSIMTKYLELEGVTTIEAENGRVGLERLADNSPALILLDLMMPELDGFGFIEEFRKHPEWHGIPIVVVTAKTLSMDEKKQLEGWVDALYSKLDTSIEDVLIEIVSLLPNKAKIKT